MASNHKTLSGAKANQFDEFYTRIEDIENELRYYKPHFKGKTVLCNCDDPRVSNFFRYFSLNFEALGLKKLIATCYKNNEPDLFSTKSSEQAVYIIYEGDKNGNYVPDPSEMEVIPLKGDGDFRSDECVELLKECDIVCTNPPFSLWSEFVSLILRYHKKFLVLGNPNAVTYKDIFPYVKNNEIWVGVTKYNVGMFYEVPDYAPKYHHIENGKKIARVSTSCWWTNLDNKRRKEKVILIKHYNPAEYPKYDNFDAIEVGDYRNIPMDYDGIMGVPITFMGHYNPEQFEIVGDACNGSDHEWDYFKPTIGGEFIYKRLLIRRK